MIILNSMGNPIVAWLADFLTLKFLVTPYLILLIYWLGAFVAPLFCWLIAWWLVRKLGPALEPVSASVAEVRDALSARVPYKGRIKAFFWLAFISLFLLFELLWRLIFEFLIVYYHIHDALIKIADQAA